jgi:hypothetical protein
MPSPAERRSWLLVVAYGFLSILVVLAIIPGYLALPSSWRTFGVRLACAAIVTIGCVRVVGAVRRSVHGYPRSPLDAPDSPPRSPELDERFLRLRDDLVFGSRSARYFAAQLWPRLSALAGGELPMPAPNRKAGRRGPSVAMLERLIGEIERRVGP